MKHVRLKVVDSGGDVLVEYDVGSVGDFHVCCCVKDWSCPDAVALNVDLLVEDLDEDDMGGRLTVKS